MQEQENKREKIKMVEYCGEMVPAELCTIDREGGADDFVGCGACFNDPEGSGCENCVVNRIFQEYARLTGQPPKENTHCIDSKEEPDIENFVVNYADGTQRVIEKGFFCEMKDEDNGEQTMSFIMSHCSGRDLEAIVFGCIQLGQKLGMFSNLQGGADE